MSQMTMVIVIVIMMAMAMAIGREVRCSAWVCLGIVVVCLW
jgi:hypothetical protein